MQETSMNSSGGTVSDSPTPANLFDEFEEAFQNCLAPLTKEDPLNGINQEELKVNAETNAQRFLELAHRMEAFFLQKRFLLSVQKPEALIIEENHEMRAELQRKEELIKKQTEKLSECQNTLMSLISRGGSTPAGGSRTQIPSTGAPPGVNQMGGTPPSSSQNNSSMPPMSASGSPMVMSHATNISNNVNHSSNIGGAQSSMITQSRVGSSVSVGSFSPMHGGTMSSNVQSPMGSAMGSGLQSGMGPNVSGGPSGSAPSNMYSNMGSISQSQGGLQGPLAYLEKTTTNIGMPESRR